VQIDRPGSRVFVLRFPAEPARNQLFWAQEPDAARDAEHVQNLHAALNADAAGNRAAWPPGCALPAPFLCIAAPHAPSAPPARRSHGGRG
jgi:hypothetical protein